jgi:ankyrin repeat protein
MLYSEENDPFNIVALAIDKKTLKPLQKLRQMILANEVNVNTCVDEISLLGQVAEAGDLELVSLMVTMGADINFRDVEKVTTPLMDAVGGGNLEIIRFLIEYGADPNIMREGNYALMIAAEQGNEKAFELLLPLTKEDWRQEAQNVLDKEIKKRKRILDKPTKSLFKAIQNNNLEKVKKAINDGADINAYDKPDYTVFYRAVTESTPEVVRVLLEAGAKPTWEFLSILVNPFASDILKVMLEFDVDLNFQSTDGITLLMIACMMRSHTEIVKILIRAGANTGLKDKNGNDAFSYAYASKNEKAIKLIQTFGIYDL